MPTIIAHMTEEASRQIGIAMLVLGIVAIIIVAFAIWMIVLVVRWLTGGRGTTAPPASAAATLTCWHCGKETHARQTACEHCGQELA